MAAKKNPNQTTADQESELSSTPPEITVGGSGNVLSPTTQLEPRKAFGVAPTLDPKSIAKQSKPGTDAGSFFYTGQNLVDKDGMVARGQYQESEAYSELASMTPARRQQFLNRLAAVGVYGNSKPTRTGFSTQDLSAMREALLYANSKGVTIDVAATLLATEVGSLPGAGTRVRTTASQDLREVFRQTAGQMLGRQLSDAEADKFVKAYQAMEVREAGQGATAPSPTTAAAQQVRAVAGPEADAMGALKLVNIIDNAIKGLG